MTRSLRPIAVLTFSLVARLAHAETGNPPPDTPPSSGADSFFDNGPTHASAAADGDLPRADASDTAVTDTAVTDTAVSGTGSLDEGFNDAGPVNEDPIDTGHTNAELTDAELAALADALARDATDEASSRPRGAERSTMAAIIQAIQPEFALTLDVSAAWFSDTPMQMGGHDPYRTGFTFNQLEMSFAANVDPYFAFRANLVFSQFGVEIEEAYAQTTSLPGRLQFRAGQFLHRFGKLNATHLHAWHFLDQPLVNGKFLGSEGARGLGAEISWLAPTPFYLEFVGAVSHPEGSCCARSFDGDDHEEIRKFGDFLYLAAAKSTFAFGPSWSLSWGASALMGPNTSGPGNRSAIWGSDLYLRFKPVNSTRESAFSLQAEFMHRRRQAPDDLLIDNGFYGQAVWRIDRRWETGLRYEYVGGLEDDPLDEAWTQARHRVSAQGTFYPSHFSRVRVQGNYDNPTWRETPIWALMLGLEFNVGAHGAHTF